MGPYLLYAGCILAAYLLGSLPTGVMLCRISGSADPRSGGSGNIGATNVFRLRGRALGGLTLLGDTLKGFLPVLAARYLIADPLWLCLVAAAAFLGHIFPVYLGFKGGKGVAINFGVFLALAPLPALLAIGLWAAIFLIFRVSSLSSLISATAIPLILFNLDYETPILILSAFTLLIVAARHHANIRRLLRGEEKAFEKTA